MDKKTVGIVNNGIDLTQHMYNSEKTSDTSSLSESVSREIFWGLISDYINERLPQSYKAEDFERIYYSSLVAEYSPNHISICDIDTLEVIYLNTTARNIHEISEWSQLGDKKCYQLFYGLEERCDFCQYGREISEDNYANREALLVNSSRRYSITDNFFSHNGRNLVMQIGVDNTDLQNERNALDEQLVLQRAMFDCIKTLSENDDLQHALNSLLRIVCEYYDANRGYICEYHSNHTLINNTYEWCRDGVSSEIGNLQNVPAEACANWDEMFNRKGAFSISKLTSEYDESDPAYQILLDQEIESLMTTPLMDNDSIYGFLGVDDPKKNVGDFTLLSSVGHFVMNDIQKRQMGAEIKQKSYEDSLTGVYNRNKYMQDLQNLEAEQPRSLGVAYVDLNGLKGANDIYGHDFGDSLLIQLAKLISCVFEGHVYRVGGDEFVVLVPNVSKEEFTFRCEQLHQLIHNSSQLKAAIGTAWEDQSLNVHRLVKQADSVMYANKQIYYESVSDTRYNYTYSLSRNVVEDIQAGMYHVYLQPQFNLSTGRLYGAEALIRRIEEDGRVLAPDVFLPLLESNGIIRHIDFFVLETVCSLLNELDAKGHKLDKIAVNFSRVTLQEYDVTSEILAICKRYNIDASRITVEITETSSIFKNRDLAELIGLLKGAGFSVSLDDYGSEYSNISTLSNVGFDEIKLDRSIVSELQYNEKARTIVTHTVAMIRDLKVFKLVAEGIETSFELDMLKEFGCDYGQGYLFSRPIPVESFLQTYFPDSPDN